MPLSKSIFGNYLFLKAPARHWAVNLKRRVFFLVFICITYLPRKAAAEVSNHNEPIGRECGIQLIRKPMDFTFNCFELQLI